MPFFPEEHVISKILNDFGDNLETMTNDSGILFWDLNINIFGRYNGWGDEPCDEVKINWRAASIAKKTYRKKIKAPMAAYLDSGHTSELRNN